MTPTLQESGFSRSFARKTSQTVCELIYIYIYHTHIQVTRIYKSCGSIKCFLVVVVVVVTTFTISCNHRIYTIRSRAPMEYTLWMNFFCHDNPLLDMVCWMCFVSIVPSDGSYAYPDDVYKGGQWDAKHRMNTWCECNPNLAYRTSTIYTRRRT